MPKKKPSKYPTKQWMTLVRVWGIVWFSGGALLLGVFFGACSTLIALIPLALLGMKVAQHADYMLESINFPRKIRLVYMVASIISIIVVLIFTIQMWKRDLNGAFW